MVDARLPERFLMDRRLQRLSDSHFRSYVNALLYAVSNRSEGQLEQEDLGLVPNFASGAAKALIEAGLWQPRSPKGWLIVDFAETQTGRDELERLARIRADDRRRKQEKRSSTRGPTAGSPPDIPPDSPRDVSAGLHRQEGEAGRQGLEGEPQAPQLFAVDAAKPRSTFNGNH